MNRLIGPPIPQEMDFKEEQMDFPTASASGNVAQRLYGIF